MAHSTLRGSLLDVDYAEDENESHIKLFVKTDNATKALLDTSFYPYYLVEFEEDQRAIELRKIAREHAVRIRILEKDPKIGHPQIWRIGFDRISELVQFRQITRGLGFIQNQFEDNILFTRRYLIDQALVPLSGIEISLENESVVGVRPLSQTMEPVFLAFDLETLSPDRFPDPKKDPILMIGVADKKETRVLTYNHDIRRPDVDLFSDEASMIQAFLSKYQRINPDVVVTYNGDSFDFPYLHERCRTLRIACPLNADQSDITIPSKQPTSAIKLKGRQHLDAFAMVKLLARLDIIDPLKLDLETVTENVFHVHKEKVTVKEMNEAWLTGKNMERLIDYNKLDAFYTLELAHRFFPVLLELSNMTHLSVFDLCRESASGIVEQFLIQKSTHQKGLVPNPPSAMESAQRNQTTFEGGFVKEPTPGLHDSIAVLDFSSLHPSIMISHNISIDSLDCSHSECREKNSAPTGHWFCTKKEGFFSSILTELFQLRLSLKDELKKMDESSPQRSLITARIQALKIVLNSFYGYLGYDRSRWYSAECASAITAWSRDYVKWVAQQAEQDGYVVLYSDTDSAFLKLPETKNERDVRSFVEKVNLQLPGVMHLEYENLYARGIFVTKESGEGAKKKYALISKEGRMKIVGFEYVRRDWSNIAKQTQKAVLQAVLADADPKKAIDIVREKIRQLKSGNVPKSDLVVYTQLRRNVSKYESIGPHVAAAQKAMERGKDLSTGSVLGFIITKKGDSISDKAELEEYVAEGNYDADYYIENQLIPAVIKIIREFGYSKEDLLHGGKQTGLGAFS